MRQVRQLHPTEWQVLPAGGPRNLQDEDRQVFLRLGVHLLYSELSWAYYHQTPIVGTGLESNLDDHGTAKQDSVYFHARHSFSL